MAELLWKRCVRADDDGSLPSILVVWVVAVLALQFTVPVVVTEHAASASCGTAIKAAKTAAIRATDRGQPLSGVATDLAQRTPTLRTGPIPL